MIKLAIVILNWNGKAFIDRFLPSVISYCPDFAQIYIADNGSTDGSSELMADKFPDIPFLQLGANYGYAGGYNRALKQIESKYYVLLNSDIEVSRGWIEPIIEIMDNDDSIAACQPKILAFNNRKEFEYAGAAGGFLDHYGYPFCRGRIFNHLELDDGQYNDQREIFWASGACMFLRADSFLKAGLFDEDFFAHMEEIDLCWRLKRLNQKVIYCPNSRIYHIGGGTLPKNNPRKTFLNFRNSNWLLAKNLPNTIFFRVYLARIILDFLAAIKFLAEGNFRDSLAVFRAHWAVIKKLQEKRQEGKSIPYMQVNNSYNRSLVIDYFLMRKKTFDSLALSAFKKM